MKDPEIKKELEHLSPLLDSIKQQRQQGLPDDYFEQLNQKIIAQNIKNEPVKTKRVKLIYLAKIAAIGIIILGMTWIIKPFFESPTPTSQDTIEQEEILAYMEDNIDNITEDELINLLDDADLVTTPTDNDLLDEIDINDINEELLEEYIEIQL